MTWKSTSLREETLDLIDENKGDNESRDDFIQTLIESDASDDEYHHELTTTENEASDVLTESHIDDIVARTSRRTAEEIESRFR